MLFRRLAAGAATVLLLVLAAPAGARAECPPFPEVPWWENLSHDSTRRYVAAKYDGDWTQYIAKWQRQLSIIESIYARGEAGIIRSKGIRLAGDDLREYVLKIEQRLAVIECLAREAQAGGGTEPRIFAPADTRRITPPPRGNAPAPQGTTTEITVPVPDQGTAGGGFQVEITAQCQGGDTVFRIVNRGDLWPEPALFVVSRSRDGHVLTNRKIRMTNGQSLAFRVQSEEPMELRVTPPWAPDDFRLAQAHCR